MNDRDDQSIDKELSDAATAATHEHEATISAHEIEAALEAVRFRADAGDLGGVPPSIDLVAERRRRSPLVLLSAVAAVVGMVTLGLVAITGGDPTNDIMTPGTTPVTRPVESTPAVEPTPSTTNEVVPEATVDPPTDSVAPSIGVDEATADPEAGVAHGDALVQPTAIERTCVDPDFCTQLANTEDGRLVSFDPVDVTLRTYDADGTELLDEVELAEQFESTAALVDVGPDDVAYIQVQTPGAQDPSNDLLALPLVGPNAGTVVMRWTGLDGSGDSTLIARKAGLTEVGCCGMKVTRPEPDATIYRWVDRNGDVTESTAPSFDLNLGDAGNSLTRVDTGVDGQPTYTSFGLPTAYQYPRDFPYVVPTDNGGALAYDYVLPGGVEVLVDFDPSDLDRGDSPDGLSNGNVYYVPSGETVGPLLLEPSGTIIVADAANDGQFVRRRLVEVATPGWPSEIRTGTADRGDGLGSTDAPGLNDYIDAEQPFWAADPELFALQLQARVGPSEEVLIEFDDADAPIITITTSGFLDDSVEGSQRVIVTERGDDGLLRFVSGSYGERCQPGRGHQDHSLELCT